jgi:hypothetical protein
MARRTIATVKTRVCDVTGLERPESEFYSRQSHLKSVDRLRAASGATKEQIQRFYQQLTA